MRRRQPSLGAVKFKTRLNTSRFACSLNSDARWDHLTGCLNLRREGDGVTIVKVEQRVRVHPYVAKMTIKYNGNKLINTCASDHESPYNLRFETDDGFPVTMGHTRHGNNQPGVTHLWVKCSTELRLTHRRRLQRLLANIWGYLGPYDGQLVAPPADAHASQPL